MASRIIVGVLSVVLTLVAPVPASVHAQQRYDDPDRSSARPNGRQVLAISLDGFNVASLTRLGRARTPYLHMLLRRGASTRNARTQVELTVTLPNHTSMVTGRRIDASAGGHGVDWNSHRPGTTVQRAAGEPVSSVFNVVHAAGGRTAFFATEEKLSIFERSWPRAIDRNTIRQDADREVTLAALRDLRRQDRAFTFLHLGQLDETGHAHGWLRPAYLRAVMRVDRLLGLLVRAIRSDPRLSDVVVVLTADHGGVPAGRDHSDTSRFANYRVPFLVWRPGGRPADLYATSRSYADPGRRQVGFKAARQPVRNGDLANLATALLGLGPVPGSRWGADQRLRWR